MHEHTSKATHLARTGNGLGSELGLGPNNLETACAMFAPDALREGAPCSTQVVLPETEAPRKGLRMMDCACCTAPLSEAPCQATPAQNVPPGSDSGMSWRFWVLEPYLQRTTSSAGWLHARARQREPDFQVRSNPEAPLTDSFDLIREGATALGMRGGHADWRGGRAVCGAALGAVGSAAGPRTMELCLLEGDLVITAFTLKEGVSASESVVSSVLSSSGWPCNAFSDLEMKPSLLLASSLASDCIWGPATDTSFSTYLRMHTLSICKANAHTRIYKCICILIYLAQLCGQTVMTN